MTADLRRDLENYRPCCEQEQRDRELMLLCMDRFDDVLTRNNPVCHFTASNWIVNRERTKVLMAWHNLYQSWAWTGGHADGEARLQLVARREAEEETGITGLELLCPGIYTIQVIGVQSHIKGGKFVSWHLHLDCCYLWQAEEAAPLRAKTDENRDVGWIALDRVAEMSSEPEMLPIYEKLNRRLQEY